MKKNLFYRWFLIPFFLTIASHRLAFAHKYEMNDVSILLPLPEKLEDSEKLIALETSGRFGEILPAWLWERLPILRSGMPRREVKPEIKLVSVRLDPCFREGTNAK